MSADNWAICPRCLDQAAVTRKKGLEAAEAAYGKVPPADYEALRAAALPEIDEEKYRTFREDYEFSGASRGKIVVDYSGHCSVCNLDLSFSHEHPFYEPELP